MWTFVGKVIALLFKTLSEFVIAFLPRSKHLLISWMQSPSTVILTQITTVLKKTRSLEFLYHYFLAVWPCLIYITSLYLSCIICKIELLWDAISERKRWARGNLTTSPAGLLPPHKEVVSFTLSVIFFLMFAHIFFNWKLIALQYCGGLCHTSTRISHNYIHPSICSSVYPFFQLPILPVLFPFKYPSNHLCLLFSLVLQCISRYNSVVAGSMFVE